MAESGVILPADSTGKALRTETATTTFTTGSGGVVHQQVVALGDPTTAANLASVDSSGRLTAAVGGAAVTAPAAVSWTSATTLNTAYTVTVANAGNVTFWFYNTAGGSPFTGTPAVAFEQSADNVNWAPLQMVRADTNQVVTSMTVPTVASGIATAVDGALEGVAFARVRLTAAPGNTNGMSVLGLAGGGFFEPSVALAQPTRTSVVWNAQAFSVPSTEALASMNQSRGAAAASSATTYAVTAGKTFRIQSVTVSGAVLGTTISASRVSLRATNSGTVTATSPVMWSGRLGDPAITTQAALYTLTPISATFGDGLDLPGGFSVGISTVGSVAAMHALDISVVGYEY